MQTVNRKDLPDHYSEMMKCESHHNHEIVLINGVLKWKEDKFTNRMLERISLNDLCPLMENIGYGKNSEIYRKLYRSMGYSLNGYWEVFYWEPNNEDCSEYKQPTSGVEGMKVTDEMLIAAVRQAVKDGILPKYAN